MKSYVLSNDVISIEVREKSAELISLKKKENKQEYLWNADPKFWGWTSPVLFPIVGSVKNGEYHYQGQTYQMAQHGFARRREFTLVSLTDNEIWMGLEEDEDSLKEYPFHFRLEIGYRLEGASVEVMWKVMNKEDGPMYFSIGGHPALLCPPAGVEKRTDCYLGFDTEKEVLQYVMVEPGTGRISDKLHSLQLDDGVHRITEGMFDYDALIFENYQVQSAYLAGPDGKPYIRMKTKSPLMAFWSPKEEAPFICFEPWFGRADGVNFNGTLEEREWGQSIPGKGNFEAAYSIEVL